MSRDRTKLYSRK